MKKLVRNSILAAGLVMFTATAAFAQTFTLTKKYIQGTFNTPGWHALDTSYVINHTDSELVLDWKVVKSTVPTEWEINLCDNVLCYLTPPTTVVSTDPIPPTTDVENPEASFKLAFNWEIDGVEIPGSGEIVLYIFEPGQEGKSGDTITFAVNASVSINKKSVEAEFNMFPNPALSNVNIQFRTETTGILQLTDISGRIVKTSRIANEKQTVLDVNTLPTGVYLLNIVTQDGTRSTRKLFVGAER